MIPFRLPKAQKRLLEIQYRRERMLVRRTLVGMKECVASAVAEILETYYQTQSYKAPSLTAMFLVSERFYRDAIFEAYQLAKDKNQKLTRMARLPIGLPKSLPELEVLFRDKRYWPKVMKRSNAIADKLRKKYLAQLKKRFEEILPDVGRGVISPYDVKKELMRAWDTFQARVETIYRTEATRYFNKTQVAFFSGDESILGFLFDVTRDRGLTEWCRSRAGLIYRKDLTGKLSIEYNCPALHWGCRSTLIPLANSPHNIKLLEDSTRDPRNRTVVDLPAGWNR